MAVECQGCGEEIVLVCNVLDRAYDLTDEERGWTPSRPPEGLVDTPVFNAYCDRCGCDHTNPTTWGMREGYGTDVSVTMLHPAHPDNPPDGGGVRPTE